MTGNRMTGRRFSRVSVTSVTNLKFFEHGNTFVKAGFARKVTFNFPLETLFVAVDVAEEFLFLVTKIIPQPLRSLI